MMHSTTRLILIMGMLLSFVFTVFFTAPLYAKEEIIRPKEFGVYIKAGKSLTRLIPNIVFKSEQEVLYVEGNNPQRFALKDVEYFVIYGKYEIKFLTFNPLLFLEAPLGKPRFIIGRDIEINTNNAGKDLYAVKTKTLLGRGYFCLWIEDTAWDFIIE